MIIFISNVYSFFIQFQENWIKQNILIHDLLVLDHHLICGSWLVNVEKFSSKELYGILIFLRSNISTSQDYFNKKLANQHLNWKGIYVLPRKITFGKIFSNLIKNCFCLGNRLLIYAHFVHPRKKTHEHIYSVCHDNMALWNQLKIYFGDCIFISNLISQATTLKFYDNDDDFIIRNLTFFIFKMHVCLSKSQMKLWN